MFKNNAFLIRIIGIIVALLWIVLLSFALPIEDTTSADAETLGFSWHQFLIATEDPMYPFNMQVLMWISFFFCIAELFIKWFNLLEERKQIEQFSLYQNPNRVSIITSTQTYQIQLDPNEALKPELLAAIYHAKKDNLVQGSLIADMFKKINHQFHSTNDVADVYSGISTMIELRLHEVDLRYTIVRYFAWLIPTLGFIGTVIGIAVALGKAGIMGGDNPDLLVKVIPLLATAFYTTLLALLLSAIVMIMLQVVQAQDELTVNEAGQFCFDQIVTNLKPRSQNN